MALKGVHKFFDPLLLKGWRLIVSPWGGAALTDFLLMNRMWWKWCWVISETRLWKTFWVCSLSEHLILRESAAWSWKHSSSPLEGPMKPGTEASWMIHVSKPGSWKQLPHPQLRLQMMSWLQPNRSWVVLAHGWRHSPVPEPQKLQLKFSLFKPLNLGVMCDTAVNK